MFGTQPLNEVSLPPSVFKKRELFCKLNTSVWQQMSQQYQGNYLGLSNSPVNTINSLHFWNEMFCLLILWLIEEVT